MCYVLQHPSISLNIKKQPARKGNVVTIIANGLRPLTYEWFLGKKKLCDNDDQDPDYDGYTTNKLVIKNDLFLTEGVLKCKVKDKSECVVESDELGKHALCLVYVVILPVLNRSL